MFVLGGFVGLGGVAKKKRKGGQKKKNPRSAGRGDQTRGIRALLTLKQKTRPLKPEQNRPPQELRLNAYTRGGVGAGFCRRGQGPPQKVGQGTGGRGGDWNEKKIPRGQGGQETAGDRFKKKGWTGG